MGTFEGVGQIDMRTFGGQRCFVIAQRTADAQFAHRVRADQQFKAVQVFSQCGGLTGDSTLALFLFDPAKSVFNDAEQIGACSDRRIERDDAGIGKTQRLAETVDEQVVNQAHLGADDLYWGVVSSSVPAQLGIVGLARKSS